MDTSGTLLDHAAIHGPLRNAHGVLQSRDAPRAQTKRLG